METYYVYILQSQFNDSFYKGSTDNLLRRFQEHNDGKEQSTSRYLPWDLIWYTEKASRSEALILEKKLKNLSVKRTIEFISKYPVENAMGVLTLAPVRQSDADFTSAFNSLPSPHLKAVSRQPFLFAPTQQISCLSTAFCLYTSS